jgi:glycine betaine/proline transport system ATP-binding protein
MPSGASGTCKGCTVTEPLIRIENLYKVFGPSPKTVMPMVRDGRSKEDILAETGHTVGLRDINLDIERGTIFVIMGLSGSGKSTLIRHFNRLIEPTEGTITIDDVDVTRLAPQELQDLRRHKMSMVFQRFGLLPHRTVLENVAFGLAIQQVAPSDRNDRAREWLRTVGLEGYEDQYPAQLSGGEQQRVGLARALCTDPEILLMDEAFSALDPLIRSDLQKHLLELHRTLRKTIVFITHDLDEALRIGDRIAILKDGALSQVGRPEEILLEPADSYVEAFVRDVNRARALTVGAVMKPPACQITADTLADAQNQIHGWTETFGYLFQDGRYRGVVTQDALDQAGRGNGSTTPTVADIAETGPTLDPGTSLQDALPAALESAIPVPVVSQDGEFLGILSAKDLGRVLADGTLNRD